MIRKVRMLKSNPYKLNIYRLQHTEINAETTDQLTSAVAARAERLTGLP